MSHHPSGNPLKLDRVVNVDPSRIEYPSESEIWIGCIYDTEPNYLATHDFTDVINVMGGNVYQLAHGISYTFYALNQPFGITLSGALAAVDKLDKLVNNRHNKIMIHCWSGIDRAPSIVWKFLIHYCGYQDQEALDSIKKARPQACPHPDWFKT